MDGYKYYSTQRPVDILTFPEPPDNKPVEIVNYECDARIPVQGENFRAWGELTYAKPLTEKQMDDYELRPSRRNPDLKKKIEEQTEAVGKWEDSRHLPDVKRLTWFYPDFGSYVLKEFVTPEQLSERFEIMQELTERPRPSITAQIKEAASKPKPEREAPVLKDTKNHMDR